MNVKELMQSLGVKLELVDPSTVKTDRGVVRVQETIVTDKYGNDHVVTNYVSHKRRGRFNEKTEKHIIRWATQDLLKGGE